MQRLREFFFGPRRRIRTPFPRSVARIYTSPMEGWQDNKELSDLERRICEYMVSKPFQTHLQTDIGNAVVCTPRVLYLALGQLTIKGVISRLPLEYHLPDCMCDFCEELVDHAEIYDRTYTLVNQNEEE